MTKRTGSYPQLIKFAGFGGQGILALGEIIALAAMYDGKNVSWLPSYGPESRGGTCNCDVILSEGDIAAPLVEHPNVAFIFNQPSMDKFEPHVRSQGTLFYDTTLASINSPQASVTCIGVPFTALAMDLGTERVANMVALGAYIGAIHILNPDLAVAAMKEKFKGKDTFFDLNERAITAGVEYVAKQT